jgi:serine/threonine protein kinase
MSGLQIGALEVPNSGSQAEQQELVSPCRMSGLQIGARRQVLREVKKSATLKKNATMKKSATMKKKTMSRFQSVYRMPKISDIVDDEEEESSSPQEPPKEADPKVTLVQKINPKTTFGQRVVAWKATQYGKEIVAHQISIEGAEQPEKIEQMFTDEMEMLRQLNHPNVMRYLGVQFNREKEEVLVLSEYVSRGTLKQMLEEHRGGFSEHFAMQVLVQAMEGLWFLHNNDITYRDLRPSRMALDEEGKVKLVDYANSVKIVRIEDRREQNSEVKFNPYYTAPEVFTDIFNEKADIWSVGCCLLELLTGSPPYHDYEEGGAFEQLNDQILPDITSMRISELAREFLSKCFQFDPENVIIIIFIILFHFISIFFFFKLT